MGLASALFTSLTGLNAAETQIDVVGNNLANSQTVGFKASTIAFTTQFLQTLSLGSSPTDALGGTNPRQTGLGTQVAEISPDFTQGTIQTSSRPADVALQGDGFFIIQGSSGETMYTRTGIFKTNSDNELVTVNGNRLLGFTVDEEFQLVTTQLSPLRIPLGSVRVATSTQNVFLEGVFTPSGDVGTTAEVIESAVLGDASVPRPDTAGTSVTTASVPDSSSVTATHTQGTGTHPEGVTYRYRFAFQDATGTETVPSGTLQVTVPAGNGLADNTITLNGLPSTTDYPTLNIYRTAADGSDFFLLDSVSSSGGSYVDNNGTALSATPLNSNSLNGNYDYLFTFYKSGQVESRPSPIFPITVSDGRVQLVNLPTPPVPGPTDTFPAYDKIRIYRNLASDSGTFHLVDTVDPGTNYTDSRSDSEIAANPTIDLDGPKITSSTLLTNVLRRDELSYESLFSEGSLDFAGRKGGRALDTKVFTITAGSTVQDLMDFLEQSTGIQPSAADSTHPIPGSLNNIVGDSSTLTPGSTITPEGRIRIISNNGTDNAVTIGLSAFTLTGDVEGFSTPNLGFGSVQEAVGQSAVADFQVFDSLGIPLNVRVTSVLEERTDTSFTYRWFADSADNDPTSGVRISVGTGLVTFDGQGNLLSVSNEQVSIDRRNGPSNSPLEFDLDFAGVSGLAANTSSLAAARQDGSPPGVLSTFSIGEDGIIRGSFSNGVSRTMGQLRLSRFANPAGLEQRGQNLFITGPNSGLAVEGNPGENGIATIVSGALELSNTDIGASLIDLVLASTQYRGNARVISSVQQLLEELLNLRR